MNHNEGNRVTRFIALAIFFVLLAGAFYVIAGKGLRSMVSMKLQMGVEQGLGPHFFILTLPIFSSIPNNSFNSS